MLQYKKRAAAEKICGGPLFNRVKQVPCEVALSNKQWVGTCLYQEWYKPLLISCKAATRL